jgi:hypothetical protein
MRFLAFSAFVVAATLSTVGYGQGSQRETVHSKVANRTDGWRYVQKNGTWWYYHPNNSWSNWNGSSWVPYVGAAGASRYTAGYQDPAGGVQVGSGAGNLSATDALPGRSDPQMAGGGLGINGSAIGTDGRNGGTPNLGGGAISRGGNLGGTDQAHDAVPGRANPQMVGGGIGVNGSAVSGTGSRPNGVGIPSQAITPDATDALPGEPDPQMAGGGLGVNGGAVSTGSGTNNASKGANGRAPPKGSGS